MQQARWKAVLESVPSITVSVLAVTLTWVTIVDHLHATKPVAKVAAAPKPSVVAPPKDPISLGDAQIRGSRTAQVAIIEYSDFQCPFCGAFARDTLPTLQRKYIDSNRVQLAFRNFPLGIHNFAEKAAEAAACAGRQGRFWEMHDALFANQKELDESSIIQRAGDLKLGSTEFSACLHGEEGDHIKQDVRSADLLDIRGTPTFFVGNVVPGGRVRVGQVLTGAEPLAQFESVLDSMLAALSSKQ
jgi:protein-disulfide isomerase